MLTHLAIRNVVLIEALELDFSGGLSVLTGETGAGKSILLDALGLALGNRADAGLVRQGADKASVTALFDIPSDHPVFAVLSDAEVEAEAPLIVRRTLGSDGRSKAFINDQPVSVRLLREAGDLLVEIHGQHDERGLLDPKGHRALLDLYGELEPLRTRVRTAHEARQTARIALGEAQEALENAARDRDYLAHALGELEQIDPKEGEEDALAADRHLMMNAEKIGDDLNAAQGLMAGEGEGLDGRLAQALRAVERAAQKLPDGLEAVVRQIETALSEVVEARARLDTAMQSLEFDAAALERTEERLFGLRALARKHQVTVDELPALMERVRSKLAAIDDGGAELARLEAAVADADAAYGKAAEELSAARAKAAKALDKAVMAELAPLKLEKAHFSTRHDVVALEEGGASGIDQIGFEVATNPGSAPGPLIKIASGGELSRFILALKVALASTGAAGTLIFDEVDRGIGGATAAAVGDRLKRLADEAQVLVVTHSPQVAALGHHHFRIAKSDPRPDATVTDVHPLADQDRLEEIARMLAGATVTDEARGAARQLLGAG